MSRTIYLFITFYIICSFAFAQNRTIQPVPIRSDTQPKVITGDDFDGIRYYVRIARSDSAWSDGMPIYQPDKYRTYNEVDQQPVPIKRVKPIYPRFNFASDVTVWVKCLVGEDGKVQKAVVMQTTDRLFDRPSIDAALQWEFMPAALNGNNVSVWAAIPFRYKVKH